MSSQLSNLLSLVEEEDKFRVSQLSNQTYSDSRSAEKLRPPFIEPCVWVREKRRSVMAAKGWEDSSDIIDIDDQSSLVILIVLTCGVVNSGSATVAALLLQ